MPTVHIDQIADDDIADIARYIGVEKQSPIAACRFIDDLYVKFDQYAHQPEMGEPREDLEAGLRSFTFKNHYVVIYRPLENGIDVLRVLHGARDYPGFFGGD